MMKRELRGLVCACALGIGGCTSERAAAPASTPTDERAIQTPPPAVGDGERKAGAPVVCVLQVCGESNEDFDDVGMEAALAEAAALSPDVIVIDVDTTWKLYRGNDQSVYTDTLAHASMRELDAAVYAARRVAVFATDAQQREHPPRMVGWIGHAVGPSGIFAFCCPEMYHRSTTVCGAIAGAFQIVTPKAGPRLWTKGRALRSGWMKDVAIRNG